MCFLQSSCEICVHLGFLVKQGATGRTTRLRHFFWMIAKKKGGGELDHYRSVAKLFFCLKNMNLSDVFRRLILDEIEALPPAHTSSEVL